MAEQSAEALRRRRNLVLFLALAALVLGVGLCTTVRARAVQPEVFYPTAAEARVRPDGYLPTLLPPSATEIYERHDRETGRVWARFRFAPADLERMTTGLRRLSLDEARALEITGPAFTPWWTINPRTLLGSQGPRLRVYEVGGDAAGWLVVDPRTDLAFYWTR
ncbi:MAG TPA: hypothetical protein VF746_04740 [Longimicrobium sp.]|jgi:hypothetical protein